MTDEDILKNIGSKLRELRIAQNLKQSELSEKSGISMFTISQMENGNNISLAILVKVLRAIDRMDMLEPFFRPPEIDPKVLEEFIPSQKSTRKRVSRKS